MKLGSTDISKVYLGSTEVTKAYLGSVQVHGGATPVLPYDAQVEYLQSSGTQYIDISVTSGNSTDITMDLQLTSVSGSIRFVGSSNTNFELYLSSSSYLSVRSNNSTKNSSTKPNTSRHTYRISNIWNRGYYDSTNFAFTHNGSSYQGGSLYLLMRPANPETGASAKIYSCLAKEGDTTLRDFIPVRVGQVGYLYDKISGQLFGNAGTGSFVLGNDIT